MIDPHKGKTSIRKALDIQKRRRSIHLASRDGEWTPDYGFRFLEGTAPKPNPPSKKSPAR